jgi:hypothetical protein
MYQVKPIRRPGRQASASAAGSLEYRYRLHHPLFQETPMKALCTTLVVLGLASLGLALYAADKDKEDKTVDSHVFELRTYHVAPGKMEALQARFRDHTNKIFKKHGMTIIGFWNPTDAKKRDRELIYILSFPSREAADKSWQAFRDDPDWKAAKEASEKDGVLVNKVDSVFMTPTDYSPIK